MKLLSEGGFRLTKSASNSRELLAPIPPASRANPKLNFVLDRLLLERALGVYWDTQSGTFKFKVLQTHKPSTKRGVLSVVSSLFDPLGFLSPFVFSAKILLQELWRQKLSWDQNIAEPYSFLWQKWSEELPCVATQDPVPQCTNHCALAQLFLMPQGMVMQQYSIYGSFMSKERSDPLFRRHGEDQECAHQGADYTSPRIASGSVIGTAKQLSSEGV